MGNGLGTSVGFCDGKVDGFDVGGRLGCNVGEGVGAGTGDAVFGPCKIRRLARPIFVFDERVPDSDAKSAKQSKYKTRGINDAH